MRTTNMLLGGYPYTSEIKGRKGQFLGYRIKGRYPSPWGMRLFWGMTALLWFGLLLLFGHVAGENPTDEEINALMLPFGIAALAGPLCMHFFLLTGKLELEIRPQVIRWRRWHGGWTNFDTAACEFALLPHDKTKDEEALEKQRYYDLQRGKNVEMPGRWFRDSASVALVVMGQRVDIASVYKMRYAQDIYQKLAALLEDVRARQWSY